MPLKTLLRALETKVWDKIWFKSKNFSLNLWATYLTCAFPRVAFRCVPTETKFGLNLTLNLFLQAISQKYTKCLILNIN